MFYATKYFASCIFLVSLANGQNWSQWASCSGGDSTATFTCYQKRELECRKGNNNVKGMQCVSSEAVYETQISDGCAGTTCSNDNQWSRIQVRHADWRDYANAQFSIGLIC